MGADAIFISYSHDSLEHSARVLALSDKLRAMGVDVELDQYHTRPSQGWPQWCEEKLRPTNSKFVLLICTETYRNRVDNEVPADEGRGVYWEGSVINNYLYREKANERFIPVLLGDESDESTPIRLQGFAKFRVKAFELSDPGFEALYRELTGQPAVLKPALGERVALGTKAPAAMQVAGPLPEKQAVTTFDPPAPSPFDISRIDRYAPASLIGREAETKLIHDAWAKAVAEEAGRPRVLTFIALGGEGKTALIAKWAVGMAEKGWPDGEAAFGWSFYSQGSSEQQAASSDLFLAEALKFFGAQPIQGENPHDKGRRIAAHVGARRAVLILDGVEPLQYPPTSPLAGQLKDEGLSALLKGLAQSSKGLCLVTTRYKIRDIEAYAAAAQRDLAPLSHEVGARLLETLGVNGTRKEREQLTADVRGHALTLTLIGGYLRDAYGGDIQQRGRIRLAEADAEEQGGHAFRAMDAYAEWFDGDGENGQRALAMLRLLGLFDRPADTGCLTELWRAPPIEGLTEPLIALSEAQRSC
jgi:TIR domain